MVRPFCCQAGRRHGRLACLATFIQPRLAGSPGSHIVRSFSRRPRRAGQTTRSCGLTSPRPSSTTPGMMGHRIANRDPVTQLPPAGAEMLARRAGHFASSVHFGLHEPRGMRRLHKLTKDLGSISRLDSLLPTVLAGALSLMKADLGNIQIVDRATGALRIVTRAGATAGVTRTTTARAASHPCPAWPVPWPGWPAAPVR